MFLQSLDYQWKQGTPAKVSTMQSRIISYDTVNMQFNIVHCLIIYVTYLLAMGTKASLLSPETTTFSRSPGK